MRNQRRQTHRRYRITMTPQALTGFCLLVFALSAFCLNTMAESARLRGALSADILSLWALTALTAGAICAVFALRGFNQSQRLRIAETSAKLAGALIALTQTLALFGALQSFTTGATLTALIAALLSFAIVTVSRVFSEFPSHLTTAALTGVGASALALTLLGKAIASALIPLFVAALLLAAPSLLRQRLDSRGAKTTALAVLGALALITILQVTTSRHEQNQLAKLLTAPDANNAYNITTNQYPGIRELALTPPQSLSSAGRWNDECNSEAPNFITAIASNRIYEFPIPRNHDSASDFQTFNNDLRFIAGQLCDTPSVLALAADGATILSARGFGAREITAVWSNSGARKLFDDLYIQRNSNERSVTGEPREFIEVSSRLYDLIFLPPPQYIEPIPKTAIAQTVEGYESLLAHLTYQGILSYTMRLDKDGWPNLIRSLQSAITALDERGEKDPARHVTIIGGADLDYHAEPAAVTVLISARPMSDTRLDRLASLYAIDGFKSLVIAGDVHFDAFRDVLQPSYGRTLTALHNQPLGPLYDARPYPAKRLHLSLEPVGNAIAANTVTGEISLAAASARAKLLEKVPSADHTNNYATTSFVLTALLAIGALLTTLTLGPGASKTFTRVQNIYYVSIFVLAASITAVGAIATALHPVSYGTHNMQLWVALSTAALGAGFAAKRRRLRSRSAGLAILSAVILYTLATQLPESSLPGHDRLNRFLSITLVLPAMALAGFGASGAIRKLSGKLTLHGLVISGAGGVTFGLVGSRYLALIADLHTLTWLWLAPGIISALAIALPLLLHHKASRRYRLA